MTTKKKILSPKRIKQQLKSAMKSSDSVVREAPATVPVFMLPHNDLSTIPEDGEVYQGFSVKLSLKPHQERRYAGLLSLSNIDKEVMEKSATTELEFKQYCRPARVNTQSHQQRRMHHVITTE